MSYDIYLKGRNGRTLKINNHEQGGTQMLGSCEIAWLNITYNYSEYYYNTIDKDHGIRWLYGKTAKETIPKLECAIQKLGTYTTKDYWEPTPGNAGKALSILLEFAKQKPNGIWDGD